MLAQSLIQLLSNSTMSSTAPSFLDDGQSFTRHIPPSTPLANVSHWLHTTHGSDTTSTYTGSYIDDGLDLLPSSTPGFGAVNARFYKHKKRRDKDGGVWNDDIARAVGGDIHRSLAKMKRLAGVEVKRAELDSKEEKRRRDKRRGIVSVPAPLKWGTFVIKGDDGRVVIIDDRGEHDSGDMHREDREAQKESKRWVKAARSPSLLPVPVFTDRVTSVRSSNGRGESRRCSAKVKTSRASSKARRIPKAFSPVPESNYSSDDGEPVKLSATSPTDFFMTGGLTGWPSPAPSLTKLSPSPSSDRAPTVPHATTWDTSTSPHTYDTRSGTRLKSKSRRRSIHTPPHSWPSAPASPRESVCSSTFTCLMAASSLRKSSGSSRLARTANFKRDSYHHYDGQEAVLNYQHPDIVEVTYDETPPGEVSYSQAGWGEKTASARSWTDAHEEGRNKGSDLRWGGPAKRSGWETDDVGSISGSMHGWDEEKHSNNGDDGNGEWDGFERPKTTSEVSVAGDSERSWPASQHSVRTQLTHRTHRSHTSHRSSRHSPTNWPTGQAASRADSALHRGSSAVHSEQNWPASAHGSEDSNSWSKSKYGSKTSSPTKYQNGFDEDNATYLNETWGNIPVRVASPHKSVMGWD
ncbi:hypothetical protein N0V86_007867 [Didymella sp. IMI 355093]|nr:hypothetical protein N0V86_007867 [Didymella sp. IMI 355093]